VLLHIGASLSTINILANGSTAFTRDIVNGGNAITEEIQRQLGISQEEAEAYKCGSAQGIVPAQVPTIIRDCVSTLAGEIQRSLDFYLATSGDREIHRVYVRPAFRRQGIAGLLGIATGLGVGVPKGEKVEKGRKYNSRWKKRRMQ